MGGAYIAFYVCAHPPLLGLGGAADMKTKVYATHELFCILTPDP